jgi:cytochrome P450
MTDATEQTEPIMLDLLFDRAGYRRLREERPVTRVRHFNGTPAWLVTRYEDIRAVLGDPRISNDPSNQTRLNTTAAPGLPPEYLRYLGRSVSMMDAPNHTRVRKLVSKVFTARRVQQLRPRVQELTDDLLDAIAGRGEVDLLRDFAYPLPFAVVSELLGVPEEFREDWRDALEGMMWGSWEQVAPGAQAMADYAVRLVRVRRENPGDDLISALLRSQDDDTDALDDDELVSLVITILNAGHETSAQLIANGTFALLSHPDQLAALRADPALLPSAIEEMLRLFGPAELAALRFTTAPVDIGGVPVPAGEVVQILWGSANRDDARFAEAERFDIARRDNAHLAFGHGIHYCLGAALARVEADVAFGTLLRRFPRLALAGEVAWKRGFPRGINRLEALPVSFGDDARRRDAA